MSKQKKTIFSTIFSLIAAVVVADIVCFVFNVFSTLIFALILGASGVGLVAAIVFLLRALKKAKKKEPVATLVNQDDVGTSMIDLYTLLGIPVQYNKDGTVKDIYQLLGIEPEFDENGKRVPTVYEQLGIQPMFDENGNEIPILFIIKNRVSRAAKVDLTSRVLTRRLTEKELEERAIREAIKRKLDEVREAGDKNQEENLKKIIQTQFPAEKPPSPTAKPPIYKIGKPGKAVSTPQLKGLRGEKIFSILAAAAYSYQKATAPKPEAPKAAPEQPKPEKPEENKDKDKGKQPLPKPNPHVVTFSISASPAQVSGNTTIDLGSHSGPELGSGS